MNPVLAVHPKLTLFRLELLHAGDDRVYVDAFRNHIYKVANLVISLTNCPLNPLDGRLFICQSPLQFVLNDMS
jgi:hypothetical protein